MSSRKRIEQDVEIIIANNVRGSFFYKSRNEDLILDMDEYGDEEYVTFGDLKKMMAQNRSILEKLKLVVVAVDHDDITVEEVVEALRLKDTYSELNSITEDGFELDGIESFIETSSQEELEKILNSNKTKLRSTIIETSVVMYREGKLKDYNKMKLIAEKIGRKDFQSYWLDTDLPEGVSF